MVQELSLSFAVLPVFLPNVVNKHGKVEAERNCVNLGNRRRRAFSKLKINYIL